MDAWMFVLLVVGGVLNFGWYDWKLGRLSARIMELERLAGVESPSDEETQ